MISIQKKLVVLVLFFSVTRILSQNPVVDSLNLILEKTEDPKLRTSLNSDIAVAFYNEQVYHDSAYFYTEKAYKLAKEYGFEKQEARALFNFGMIYSSLGDFDTAIDYYKKAQPLFEDNISQSVVNSSIGALYFQKDEFDLAGNYFQQAIEISQKANDTIGEAIDRVNLGEVAMKKGDFVTSKENLEMAIAVFSAYESPQSGAHVIYANTLLGLNQIPQAENEAILGYKLAQQEKDLVKMSEATEILYKLSKTKEDHQNALNFYEEHVGYKDSLNDAKEKNNIEKLKLNFDLTQKEEELAYISQKNKYMNIIYVLGALGVLLLIFLISRQRKMAKMTQEIHDVQNRLISRELEARELRKKKSEEGTSNFDLTRNQDKFIN